jgi:hypothetical protein
LIKKIIPMFFSFCSPSQQDFQEISIVVPPNPYGLRTDKQNCVRKDENGYLTPGFPTSSESQPFGETESEKRLRKISSPARTRFYSPDKEILAKFNSR